MIPPQQGFDADDSTVAGANDGLIFESKFMPLNRVTQVIL